MTETNKKPVRYMDFVGGRRNSSTDPLISRPKTVSTPVRSSSATSSRAKPLAKARKPSPSSAPGVISASRTNPQAKLSSPEPKILYSKKPVLEEKATKAALERTNRPKAPSKSISVSDGTGKPRSTSSTLGQKASATLASSKKSLEYPDNNAYSLGGKSPFLENYSIDKRPLSDSVPAKKQSEDFEKLSFLGVSESSQEEKGQKNRYEKKPKSQKSSEQKKKKDAHAPVTIIDNSSKKSGLPIAVVILITIILGAAAGTAVYFLLPK